jgi:hypothetical protein
LTRLPISFHFELGKSITNKGKQTLGSLSNYADHRSIVNKCRWFIRHRRTCQPTDGKSAAAGGIQEFIRKEFGQ